MDLKNRKLVLASGSPRRKDLLTTAGLQFIVRKKDIDESYPDTLTVDKISEYLAVKKAEVQTELMSEDEILITADTVVAFQNKEYGKPVSRKDSIHMLCMLSNQEHFVYTGVCLKSTSNQKSFTCESSVKFGSISVEEAGWYFDNYDPSDKAGSYGIQDWLGRCKVEWIKGSYTNILGLPLSQTLEALQSFIHMNE